ncbi:MAG: MCE family protein [Bacteroidetes bacterium]|jgi:phospholipid/cholesterol/gamma-HCH transport system substrate-binding protein|nr:MCE family protein [Bacteroidota bacterium]
MKSSNFKVRLGLFVAGGFILFAVAIFLIGRQKNLFNPVFKLTTTFHNVSGLQVGNNIRFSGINIGTVESIKIINDTTVQVDMIIQRSVQQFIRKDCQVLIGSEGIIGDRVLVITQSTTESPQVLGGQSLLSVEPTETDAILVSLSVTAKHVEVITEELAQIMTNINQGNGTLGRLIQDSTIAKDINETIINFKNSSAGVVENMDVIMKSFNKTAGNVQVTSNQLAEIVTSVNQGQGTIGRLIQDTTVAENINQTIINLKNSSKGLDDNLEALKSNFLFRRYFRKRAEEEAKMREDSILMREAEMKRLQKENVIQID